MNDLTFGATHNGTPAARDALAHWTMKAGYAAGARDQFAGLLPVEEDVHDPEHPGALAARYGLACWTGMAGDAAGARDQLAGLLPVMEQVLCPRTRPPWQPA